MSTITHDGFWPAVEPKEASANKKSLMERFLESQERRAKIRMAHVLGNYDTAYLRKIGLSKAEVNRLVGSRYTGSL